ncbi:unnamed protein product [Trichogramma brassicae]|uniref:Reverse transcriptase domain-containing protein n=1 Tax=Trichogramma brassicae TaxID=86971 RepID=A0A6H5IEG4_9HYME|nr:unnamed protein product [Trichogramma brassicae]
MNLLENKIMNIEKVKSIESRSDCIIADELNVDKDVTVEQKEQLLKILNEYRMCVAKNLDEIGKTDVVEMNIEMTNDSVVHCKPYRLNATDRRDLEKLVDEYKQAGLVTETSSAFASPAFLIRKKDGSPRMIKLNENNGNYITTAHVSQLKIWKNTSLNDECFDEQLCESVESVSRRGCRATTVAAPTTHVRARALYTYTSCRNIKMRNCVMHESGPQSE